MKTDLLTARLLSAYSAKPGDEIDLALALDRDDPQFLESVNDGYELLKRHFAPGAKVERTVRMGDAVFPVRLQAHKTVASSIGIDNDAQTFFDNFLITGWLAEILTDSYIGSPVEDVIEHPIIAGNGIKIQKVTALDRTTLFVTDRTEAENMLSFGEGE